MFIPPAVYVNHGHKSIVNKTIVYSDTVLNLKELGNNIKISSIRGVSKFSFETCLECILDENPDVTFNTIQYSQQNETVYFYTDKEISTKSWDKRNCLTSLPIKDSSSLIGEITKVISSSKNTHSDIISLASLNKLLREKYSEFRKFKRSAEWKLETALKQNIASNISFCFHRFDYTEKNCHFSFKRYSSWDDFYISISTDGDLYISETSSIYKNEVLYAISSIIPEIFDGFLKFEEIFKQSKYNIYSINSNFKIDISAYQVAVKATDFMLYLYTSEDNYAVVCNSSLVMSKIKGNEHALFEKIYVKIDNCPKWMQEDLYSIRQNELKPKVIDSPTKKESFIKKLFSFFKKN